MSTTNIYILKLKNNKYYIGKTNDVNKRFQQHVSGTGSSWTSTHEPIKILKVIENASQFDEDKYVKEYMNKYGIDNVRGGAYVSNELDEVKVQTKSEKIIDSDDEDLDDYSDDESSEEEKIPLKKTTKGIPQKQSKN